MSGETPLSGRRTGDFTESWFNRGGIPGAPTLLSVRRRVSMSGVSPRTVWGRGPIHVRGGITDMLTLPQTCGKAGHPGAFPSAQRALGQTPGYPARVKRNSRHAGRRSSAFTFPHFARAVWKTVWKDTAPVWGSSTFPFPAPGQSPICQAGCTARCAPLPAGCL